MRHVLVTLVLLLAALPAIAASTPSMLDLTVTQVAAGTYHVCALTTAGGVECWGQNSNGQLGTGIMNNETTPAAVNGLASGVVAIATGGYHTCALMTVGFVKCWGNNAYGQLGDNTMVDKTTPAAVLTSQIVAIAAGSYHTCALTTAGAVLCWGYNTFGQLGDGTKTSKAAPVLVSGLGSGVIAIAAGTYHTCALTTAGVVKCWGSNAYGQLDDGTTVDRTTPVVAIGVVDIAAIATGGRHTCALARTGTVKCWGYNAEGELGDGSTTTRTTPVVVSGLSDVASIATTGGSHTCAVTTSGAVKCWGFNFFGQLGNGSTTNAATPVAVTGLTGTIAITAGSGSQTCALSTLGGLTCWGYNAYGQLGDDTTIDKITPVNVFGFSSGVSAIAVGANHTCAMTTTGAVRCWGRNLFGQLGDGDTADATAPVAVRMDFGLAAIAAGGAHTCALTTAGAVRCWGRNLYGQLGDGTTTDATTPIVVSSGFAAITAGGQHTCALTTAGAVKCWGYNNYGELGTGTASDSHSPTLVSGLTSGVIAIAAAYYHTCAVTTVGAVECWGKNSSGQLGDGSTDNSFTPTAVFSLTSGVASIAAGYSHTCALTTAGAVKCWGNNYYGQLGNGNTTSATTPVAVSGLASGVVAIAAGDSHTCALTTAGAVKCWGYNGFGQIGDSTTTDRSTPVPVSGLTSGVVAIAAGDGEHTCALTAAGAVRCWGGNSYGQLGIGDTTKRLVPATLLAGQSIAFVPSARIGVGNSVSLFASAAAGQTSFDTWTSPICGINAGDNQLFASPTGELCGVRASQGGGSDGNGGTFAAAPQQLRLLQVEPDLVFANGLDIWGGLNH